jgi:hypothetical protein
MAQQLWVVGWPDLGVSFGSMTDTCAVPTNPDDPEAPAITYADSPTETWRDRLRPQLHPVDAADLDYYEFYRHVTQEWLLSEARRRLGR